MNTPEELKATLKESALKELREIVNYLAEQEQESYQRTTTWAAENFPAWPDEDRPEREIFSEFHDQLRTLQIEDAKELLRLYRSFVQQFVALVSLGGEITKDSELSLVAYGGFLHAGMIFHRHAQEWSVHS